MSRQPDISPADEQALAPMRVAISMPTHTHVPFVFAYDLAKLFHWTAATVPKEVLSLTLNASEGTYIHRMRQELVSAAIKTDSTHILFLDTDMRFPPETLLHLMSRKEPIVGANYAQRRSPPDFVAVKERAGENLAAVKLVTDDESTGMEEVEGIGFGAILIQIGVFAELGPPPWFQNIWDENLKRWVGEDIYFCELARKAGLRVMADHDLSKQIQHVGTFEFGCEHVVFARSVTGDQNGDHQSHDITGSDQTLVESE